MQALFTSSPELLRSEFVERSILRLEGVGVEVTTRERTGWCDMMLDFEGMCLMGKSQIEQAITDYINADKDEKKRLAALEHS